MTFQDYLELITEQHLNNVSSPALILIHLLQAYQKSMKARSSLFIAKRETHQVFVAKLINAKMHFMQDEPYLNFVIQELNQYENTLVAQDELIQLFSAYFSVFEHYRIHCQEKILQKLYYEEMWCKVISTWVNSSMIEKDPQLRSQAVKKIKRFAWISLENRSQIIAVLINELHNVLNKNTEIFNNELYWVVGWVRNETGFNIISRMFQRPIPHYIIQDWQYLKSYYKKIAQVILRFHKTVPVQKRPEIMAKLIELLSNEYLPTELFAYLINYFKTWLTYQQKITLTQEMLKCLQDQERCKISSKKLVLKILQKDWSDIFRKDDLIALAEAVFKLTTVRNLELQLNAYDTLPYVIHFLSKDEKKKIASVFLKKLSKYSFMFIIEIRMLQALQRIKEDLSEDEKLSLSKYFLHTLTTAINAEQFTPIYFEQLIKLIPQFKKQIAPEFRESIIAILLQALYENTEISKEVAVQLSSLPEWLSDDQKKEFYKVYSQNSQKIHKKWWSELSKDNRALGMSVLVKLKRFLIKDELITLIDQILTDAGLKATFNEQIKITHYIESLAELKSDIPSEKILDVILKLEQYSSNSILAAHTLVAYKDSIPKSLKEQWIIDRFTRVNENKLFPCDDVVLWGLRETWPDEIKTEDKLVLLSTLLYNADDESILNEVSQYLQSLDPSNQLMMMNQLLFNIKLEGLTRKDIEKSSDEKLQILYTHLYKAYTEKQTRYLVKSAANRCGVYLPNEILNEAIKTIQYR